MAQKYGVTLSLPTRQAACWKFFCVIDDHTKLAKVRPNMKLKTDSTAQYAICNMCGDIVLCRDPKSRHITTSNMTRHLRSKHKYPINGEEMSLARLKRTQEDEATKELKQQSILSSAKKKLLFHKQIGPEVKEDHQWKVVEYILTECLPFNTMEKKSFRDLPWASEYCSKMDKRTVQRLVEQKYSDVLARMRQQMEHQVVSVTLDHCTSNANHNYSGMSGHYIDDNWILQQHDLGCFLHEGKTTATAIKEDYLQKHFNELGLQHLHVAAITTDTEGKMNSFGVQLHEDLNIDHLYCVDHNIQLTAKLACDDKYFGFDADNNPCKLIQKCKTLVSHYRSSTQAAQKLAEKLKTAGKTF
jgi:hypothetical protein